MITTTAQVAGIEVVKAEFDVTERNVRLKMYRAVEEAAQRVFAGARANLSGQVLNVRSGKTLAGMGITYRQTADTVTARVGTDWYVGRFWEKGFNGQQSVRSYLRSIKSGKRFELQRLKGKKKMKLVTTKVYATGAVQVRGYSRSTDGKARPFLEPALDAVRSSFRASMMDIARNPNS